LANHSSVSSGASSGSVQPVLEACFFPVMSVPHRDYPPSTLSWRPHHNDETCAQVPDGDEAFFPVVPPIGRAREVPAGEHQFSVRKVQPALGKRDLALRRVPRIYHLMYPQKLAASRQPPKPRPPTNR
jgi:hypothetical protein